MKKRKLVSLLLSGALVFGLLAGCGGGTTSTNTETPDTQESGAPSTENPSGEGFEMTVNIASEPQTIDPALNSAVDGAIMISHMFEGLMRWDDSGAETVGSDGTCNNAVLAEGQAESYEKTPNEDGTVTYTFKLRDDIKWSDGKDVTAQDFVFSWQRLVSPETAADYSYMIDCVVNANEIMNGEKEPSELGVKAVDEKTFEVTITSDLPYFLEICAFPACFPVREDVVSNAEWTYTPETYISNGPYVMSERVTNSHISMVPNEHYWDFESLGPDTITFHMMDDANAMISGYRSGDFNALLAAEGVRHLYTRPFSPWQNGKVERMNRTLAQEWQYGRAWDGEAERADALPAYLEHYNWSRPHSACGGLPPMSRIPGVNNLLAHNI